MEVQETSGCIDSPLHLLAGGITMCAVSLCDIITNTFASSGIYDHSSSNSVIAMLVAY